jgi:hypothetical protein
VTLKGVEKLCDSVRLATCTLEALVVHHLSLKRIGCDILMAAAATNASLKELNVSWNDLVAANSTSITRLVRTHSTLEFVDATFNTGLIESRYSAIQAAAERKADPHLPTLVLRV